MGGVMSVSNRLKVIRNVLRGIKPLSLWTKLMDLLSIKMNAMKMRLCKTKIATLIPYNKTPDVISECDDDRGLSYDRRGSSIRYSRSPSRGRSYRRSPSYHSPSPRRDRYYRYEPVNRL